jgi:Uma2 family endonuclease
MSETMTTAEYLQTAETVLPRELAFGVLRVAESPTANHQRIVRDLTMLLHAHVRDRYLGEVLPAPMDVILDFEAALVVQPDILFVSLERSSIVGDRVQGAPDLVVEVLSPHPRIGQLHERVEWFARYGVRECWLIDLPKRAVVVLNFEDGLTTSRALASGPNAIPSTVLPQLSLTADAVFGYLS